MKTDATQRAESLRPSPRMLPRRKRSALVRQPPHQPLQGELELLAFQDQGQSEYQDCHFTGSQELGLEELAPGEEQEEG